ncbi:Bor/Iss family lipoprotein [Catalinimonas niigatensis]|uniref:Bor/Iss family lipoprotein n=1 Tax=Catalinimonas niigatensis TaxID=1397264 RepID=UPI002665FE70|nr:hypothetical protein [Catalinimonas niigatensis]WPP48865.1 hypothetical protein PZB72_19540 [Catalinimonas niigatensis]
MIKKAMLVTLIVASLSACMTVEHTVGQGAQGPQTTTERQWYVLWGLVPINEVDSKQMAQGKADYSVKSQIQPLDFVINAITGFVSVYSQTVEVQY